MRCWMKNGIALKNRRRHPLTKPKLVKNKTIPTAKQNRGADCATKSGGLSVLHVARIAAAAKVDLARRP